MRRRLFYNPDMSNDSRAHRAAHIAFFLRVLGTGLAVAVLAAALGQAVAHLHDLSQVNHVVGEWIALAQALSDGVFYPPLEQGGHYGGTRYVPVFFVLISGLAKVTPDYLVAAKLASLLSVGGLLTVVFVACRRVTGHSADGLLAAGAALAFPEVWRALQSPHADALAAALSVAGLVLCSSERMGKARLALASLLFALAMGTKFSSVAGPAAACLTVFQRDRRAGLSLAALTAGLTIGGLFSVNALSDGRFLENTRALASGGMSAGSLPVGPVRLAYALKYSAILTFVVPILLPAAGFVLVRRAREGRFSVWEWYLLFTWGTSALIFASPGTDLNHLLELEVASVLVLVAGLRPAAPAPSPVTESGIRALFAIALLLALVRQVGEWTSGPAPDAVPPARIAEAIGDAQPTLSEDPTVPVLMGQRPFILDAFAYRILAEQGRIDPEQLAGRIRRHEFATLVLLRNVHDPNDPLNARFTEMHFGPQVTRAMAESYRFEQKVGAYSIFRPKQPAAD
ncbi:MAG: hypothetical protein J2P46_00540 [Zavarzinella sp.]|nr:hypothetical protein [Zavarzinella sp.]